MDIYSRTFRDDGFTCFRSLLPAGDLASALAEAEVLITQASNLKHSTEHVNLEAPGGGFYSQDGKSDAFPGVVRKINDLERLSDFYADLALRPTIMEAAADLVGAPVRLYNTILWCKPARLGSEKPLHQDAPFFAPPLNSYVTIWIALDRADEDNGCLRFVPGSHRHGMLPFSGAEMIVDPATYAGRLIACPLEPGDAVAFHACALHQSNPNASDRPRRAVMLRYQAER